MTRFAPPALLHAGELHPGEVILVLLLGFGPFLALAVHAVLTRRRQAAETGRVDDEAAPEPVHPSEPPEARDS